MEENQRRMAENYEITQAVQIGDKEVVFGVDEKAEMPYFCGFFSANEIFGAYTDCMVGGDYVEMVELFSERIRKQCGKVRDEQAKVTVPRQTITEDMCIPIRQCGDIVGKIMAVRADALRPEYRSADHQLVYVTGGNGAREKSLGSACYGITLYSGKHIRWERHDLQGEVKAECLPQWAGERSVEIREQKADRVTREQREKEVR